MNLRNRVQLIGNLGAAPEIKEFGNSKKLARFSIATTEVYKKEGKLVKETQWHNMIAWDKIANIVEKNLITGSEVIIDGRIMHRSYSDSAGEKKTVTEIVVENLMFRNKKKSETLAKLELENKIA